MAEKVHVEISEHTSEDGAKTYSFMLRAVDRNEDGSINHLSYAYLDFDMTREEFLSMFLDGNWIEIDKKRVHMHRKLFDLAGYISADVSEK